MSDITKREIEKERGVELVLELGPKSSQLLQLSHYVNISSGF